MRCVLVNQQYGELNDLAVELASVDELILLLDERHDCGRSARRTIPS